MPSMAMISSPALFSFPTQSIAVPNPNTHLFSASFPNPKRLSLPPLPRRRLSLLPAFAAAETLDSTSTADPQPPVETKRLGVAVKAMEKPRLVLRFIWMEKNIGIALDQAIPGHGTVPLSPYYFWPRKDAWEELKSLLESKPWISQKRMIILLNQATDIINLWQQAGGNL